MTHAIERSPTVRRWLAAAVVLVLGAGLWSSTSGSAATSNVEIRDFAFQPPDLTVQVGDTVTWTNHDGEVHAVEGGPMHSPEIPPNGTFSFTFTDAGDVSYFCRFHTYMTGQVHVVDPSATTTTAAPPSTTTSTTAAPPPDGSTTTTAAPPPDGSTTTTTATPPPADGPAFQDVPDDPSARRPPTGKAAPAPDHEEEEPPPDDEPSGTTTTTAPGSPPPSFQDVPDDPSDDDPPDGSSSGDPGGGGGGEAQPLGDGTVLAPYETDGDVKVFHLDMAPTTVEVAPGVTKDAYAFNGLVPGPVLRVDEGDRVRIVVDNQLPFATAVHWHGMILPNDQDGVPGITQPAIEPGEQYTYEWTAKAAGTHWYHSHSSGRHIGKGLYGALEVVPETGDIEADRDYRLMLGDTDLGFTLNGRSFPSTTTLAAAVGETVRIRVINAGDQVHAMHLHGSPFAVVAQDGISQRMPESMDTLTISPGQTFDLVAEPTEPGQWLLHCHIFAHSHMSMDDHPPGETGMTGMVTILDVAPAGSGTSALPIAGPGQQVASPALVPVRWLARNDAPLPVLLLLVAAAAPIVVRRRGRGRRTPVSVPTRKDQP